MKKFLLIPLALSISFCNCTKSAISKSNDISIESNCPENGTCTITVEKNKSIIVKTDDLGGIYYQFLDNPNTSVIHYQYNRTVEEGLKDGHHREEILFEIDNDATSLNLENKEIQKTKMLFGRHCYCKGMAGYFKVEEGVLHLENKNNVITLDLDFKIIKVPQLFNKIKATVK